MEQQHERLGHLQRALAAFDAASDLYQKDFFDESKTSKLTSTLDDSITESIASLTLYYKIATTYVSLAEVCASLNRIAVSYKIYKQSNKMFFRLLNDSTVSILWDQSTFFKIELGWADTCLNLGAVALNSYYFHDNNGPQQDTTRESNVQEEQQAPLDEATTYFTDAIAVFRNALQHQETTIDHHDCDFANTMVPWRVELSLTVALQLLASIYQAKHRLEMAVQHYAEVVDMNQSILAKIQASPAGHAYTLDAIHDVAHGLLALVDCYIQLGEFNLAKERFQAFTQWCEQYRFRAVALVDGEDFGANQQPDKTVETLLAEYEQLILQQKEHQPDTPSCSADSGNLGSDVEVGLPLKLAILYLSHGGVSGGAAATVPSNDDDDGTTTSTTPKAHAAAAVFSLMEMAIHSYKQPEHANSAKMAVCKYNLSLYHLCHGSWLQATLLFGQALDIFDALDEFDHQELLFSLLPTLRQTHDFWPTLKRPIHVHRLPGESSMSFQIPVAAGEKEHATNDNASLAHHKFDSIKDASQNTGSSIPHVTTTTTPNQVAKVKGIITVANLDGGEQRQGQRAREEVIATLVLDVKQFLDQNKSVTA